MVDLVIKNGIVVTPQGLIRGGLAVAGGKITQISSDLTLPSAENEIDARGNYLFPGVIDPHVHLGLGATKRGEDKFREDFKTESIAAAVGGVTTIISTAYFSGAGVSLLPCIRKAKEIGSQNSIVDFKFTGSLMTEPHLQEIPKLMEEGVTSFKFFASYKGEEAKQVGLSGGITWNYIYRGLENIAACGSPALAMIHCEESEIIDVLRPKLQAQGRTDLAAWADSRPGICEAMHAVSSGLMAQETGTPLYFVHVSAKETVDAVHFLRQRGAPVYVETCPHYLLVTKHAGIGVLGKVNPPVRDEADCKSLWQAMSDGTVDTIGTDHCSYQRWQKEKGGIWDGMPGFGGIDASLALLVSEGVNKSRITWERLAQVTAENPARLFGIYPQKGVLSPGSDADIVVVAPHRQWTLGTATLKSSSDFSVYEGRQVTGKAVMTFVRGQMVAQDGQPVTQVPVGAYVYPH